MYCIPVYVPHMSWPYVHRTYNIFSMKTCVEYKISWQPLYALEFVNLREYSYTIHMCTHTHRSYMVELTVSVYTCSKMLNTWKLPSSIICTFVSSRRSMLKFNFPSLSDDLILIRCRLNYINVLLSIVDCNLVWRRKL